MALPLKLEATQTNNLTQVRLCSLVIFYSYHTPIAYMEGGKMTVRDVREQSMQTKKHTTVLEPDIGFRQPPEEFLANLEAAMKRAIATP